MVLQTFDKLMCFIVALYLILQPLNFSSLPLALTPEALDFGHNALVSIPILWF